MAFLSPEIRPVRALDAKFAIVPLRIVNPPLRSTVAVSASFKALVIFLVSVVVSVVSDCTLFNCEVYASIALSV